MKYRITVKLLSDLSTQNGASFGSTVDNDVCTDADGLPYLPAKRLKGLLKQAYLDYIDVSGETDETERYFGESDSSVSPIHVSDARIRMDSLIGFEKPVKNDLFHNRDIYLYERTQTRINEETGSCVKGSLRTTSVVKKGNEFLFDLDTDMEEALLGNVLSMFRHMGCGRTRGFGNVRLTYVKAEERESQNGFVPGNKKYSVLLRAKTDILISSRKANESMDYIPGSALLGFFAYRYIKEYQLGENADKDSRFRDIFLGKKVSFSNAYISDEEGREYLPLPAFLQKRKNKSSPDEKDYVNGLKHFFVKEIDDRNEKKQKMKAVNGYGLLSFDSVYKKDIRFSVNYHHQRDWERTGDGIISDGDFYQYEALSRGQYFLFHVESENPFLLESLLRDLTTVRVGKSKTAQYGELEVVSMKPLEEKTSKIRSKRFALVFDSPFMALNKDGDPITDGKDFREYLNEKCNLDLEEKDCQENISTILVGGYQMKWNLPKIASYAIDKGSYFAFRCKEETELPSRLSLGFRRNEGFGNIRLFALSTEKKENAVTLGELSSDKGAEKEKQETSPSIIKDRYYVQAKGDEYFEDIKDKEQVRTFYRQTSLVQRVTLMLKESDSLEAFKDAVMDIKTYIDNNPTKEKNADLIQMILFEDSLFVKENIEEKFYKDFFKRLLTRMKYEGRKDGDKE